MNQPLASTGGVIAEVALALRASEIGLSLWLAVLGTCSVLLGAGLVVRRRVRSPPPEPASPSRPLASTPPVLTDEERVVDLLESNGGRIHQTRIVERTDWSKSKVSMLLSRMEDDGTIHKLRVGRENVISLPGSEPVAIRSADEREP